MRTEKQVFDQILAFAHEHDAIRAVSMNGSRVNPNAPKDFFCDYDVVYFVPDPRQFLADQAWISSFGELIILQQNDFIDHGADGCIFLMLFSDGVRIDLSFNHLSNLAYLHEDSLTVVLLDKDGRIPPLPPPSDRDYLTLQPTQREFSEAVNEVFWCSNNVAKGIWRDELPYVKYMYDTIIRDAMLKILAWYASMRHDWNISSGKYGKWLNRARRRRFPLCPAWWRWAARPRGRFPDTNTAACRARPGCRNSSRNRDPRAPGAGGA